MNRSYILLSLFPVLILTAMKKFDEEPVVKEDVQHTITAGEAAGIPAPTQEELDLYAISEHIQDGQRSNEALDEEWAQWVGDTKPIKWQDLKVKKPLRLSMILTEVRNEADTPFRILHLHSFGFGGNEDDTMTLYTRKIDGLEERSFRSNLVVSHRIDGDGELLSLSEAHRNLYQVDLVHQSFKRPYDLREPQVQQDFSEVLETDMDFIRSLIESGSGLVESGLYEREIEWNGQTYQVELNLRETQLETTTIEVQIRPLDSPTVQKFALIYEPV